MKSEIISQEKNVMAVKAEFEAEEVNKAVDATYKTLSTKANIRGFRKGHIPRKTIELYFSKKGIYGETIERIVPDAIEKIIEEYELNLISDPDIKPGDMEENKPFEVTVTFELSPEVTLPDLETITAEKTVYKATEQMRDDNIKRFLEAHAEIVPTYEEREIRKEDYVSVKYTSSIEDTDGTTKEVEKDQKTEINLSQENMRKEVVDAVVGKKPGDSVSLTFPVEKDNEHKELAGKKMHYDFEILGIMKRQVPELTDEKVAEFTYSKQKTVEEFKTSVMEQLTKAAEAESTESLKSSALNAITEKSEVDIPEKLIERQKNAIKSEQEERIKRESQDPNMTFEEFFKKSGMDKDKYEADLAQASLAAVKRSLVIEAIADANEIEWTPEELNAEIKQMAAASHVDAKKLSDYIYADRARIFDVAERIRNRKTLDFITTKVKVKEVDEPKKQEEKTEKTVSKAKKK